MTSLSDEYVAGFFDGEGYIGITRCTRALQLRCDLNQKFPEVLEMVAVDYSSSPVHHVSRRKGGMHRVYWYGHAASQFLARIEPYLIVKQRQAELAIWFQAYMEFTGIRRQSTRSQSQNERLELLAMEVKRLKRTPGLTLQVVSGAIAQMRTEMEQGHSLRLTS